MKNAITNNYFEFNNISDLISNIDTRNKEEFFDKFSFHKTDDMCSSTMCPNKANYEWNVPFFKRILRSLSFEFNFQGCKSCKECLRSYCKSLNTPKKYWKKI